MILNTVKFDIGPTDSDAALLERTISGTYSNSNVSVVRPYAFEYCQQLQAIDLPQCSVVYSRAFESCFLLSVANLPQCISIDSYAFNRCTKLSSVSLPLCESIGQGAFYSCTSLLTISLPRCVHVQGFTLAGLISANLLAARFIESGTFYSCKSLRTIYIYWPGSAGYAGYIDSSAFRSCFMLESIYLLGSNRKSLTATNAFMSTPISTYTTKLGHNGSIFVPASLLTSYQTATNWSVYSARFVGLTDAEVSAIKAQMGL